MLWLKRSLHRDSPPFPTVQKGFRCWILLKNVPIMPCSSPHHAPPQVRGQRLGPNVLLGTGLRPTNARVRKWTCSRINSYFDPSVRSDCGSLMSICLAGISLAPGNPTGFLRIGEGFEGCPIRHEHTHTHSLRGSMSEGGTRGGSGCWCVCVLCSGATRSMRPQRRLLRGTTTSTHTTVR